MRHWLFALAALFSLSSCLKKIALSSLADGLSGTGSAFSGDEDPELVADAVPFALKTMESLMPELPDHADLRVSACSGFTQYAYAFVLTPAKTSGNMNTERAGSIRAKKLLLRARKYCIQALEIRHKGFTAAIADKTSLSAQTRVITQLDKEDVPALYWLSASTALTVTSFKEQIDMLAELPVVDVLIRRAVALDPQWDHGALWEFLISFDGGRSEVMGGSVKRAREAFDKAIALSQGKRVSPYVALAENVSVSEQNRKEFMSLLNQALAVDLDAAPESRLANTLARRQAQRLMAQVDDLILGDDAP
jgi:predicted anti-sigma-YlaC factor YlaD